MMWKIWNTIKETVLTEFWYLVTFNASNRHWAMPFCAALATGLPLFIGMYFGYLNYGLVSSLGGIVFLYTPATPLHHRMVVLMACAFGMSGCYALGLMAHFQPVLLVPVLTVMVVLVSMICRFYRVAPPGSLFFIMAAAIGVYFPMEVLQIPLFVGLLSMGCLLAVLIAFFYSLYILSVQGAQPITPLPPADFDFVVFDPIIIGAFVGLSLTLAQILHLERSYWVPVSCLAIIQGETLRAVWSRQVHRILGTAIGILLTWGLFELPLDGWGVAMMMTVLVFIIETLVVRHYGLAVVFITPLTIFLADATTLGHGPPGSIVLARLFDTVLGSVIGLLGGLCLHNPRFRTIVGRLIRWTIPSGLLP
ncbi:MAG: FUSC family protein [Rhodospirillaceae bacterium]